MRHSPDNAWSIEESPAAILRQLDQDREQVLTEAEYRRMRAAVVEELARGIRCRPFTLITFAAIGLGLLFFLVLGISLALNGPTHDYMLAVVSALALIIWIGVFRAYLHGVREDRRRRIDERLAELEELRTQELVSVEEYDYIRGGILMSRQRN